ncbi:hypothetical protein F4703DRAFT_1387472 [Phycomyces blakesleeanus]
MFTTNVQQLLESNYAKTLDTALKRYHAVINSKSESWIKIKHEDLPRASTIQLYKKIPSESDIGTDTYKVVLECPKKDRSWSLDDWRSVFDTPGLRSLWDQQVESHSVLRRPEPHTVIAHTKYKDQSGKLTDQVWIEKSIKKKNTIKFIAAPTPDPSLFGLPKGSTSSCLMMGYMVQLEPSHPFVGSRCYPGEQSLRPKQPHLEIDLSNTA